MLWKLKIVKPNKDTSDIGPSAYQNLRQFVAVNIIANSLKDCCYNIC